MFRKKKIEMDTMLAIAALIFMFSIALISVIADGRK